MQPREPLHPEAMRPGHAAPAEPTGREEMSLVVLDAWLALSEGRAVDAREALREAARARGLDESRLGGPEGGLADVLGGAAASPASAKAARRLLAAGYLARIETLGSSERSLFEARVARAAASARSPCSLTAALAEAGGAKALHALADRAAEAALGRKTEGWRSVAEALAAIESAAAGGTTDEVAVALAALALEPESGRVTRLTEMVRRAAEPGLLAFLSASPEIRQDRLVFAAIARDEGMAARACVARVLAAAGDAALALADAAVDAPLVADSAARGARLYSDVSIAGGAGAAAPVARALARRWSGQAAALTEAVRQAPISSECAVEMLVEIGNTLLPRAAEPAAAVFEAALQVALAAMEAGEPVATRAAASAALALVGAGQGAAVVAQLLGTGAQVSLGRGPQLTTWANLNLAIGRRLRGTRPIDATAFYVNLLAVLARVPDRLGDFGEAAPLLARVRSRLSAPAAARRSEAMRRLDRENHLHGLADEVARLDAGSPIAPGQEPQAPETSPRSSPVALHCVDGVRLNPPSRLAESLRAFTGYEILRRVLAFLARGLGYRRTGRLHLSPDTLVLEQTSRLLGQTVRTRREEIAPRAIVRLQRVDRTPVALLVLGVLVLVALTWFGVSLAYDGVLIGDHALVGVGLGAVTLGLFVDWSLYSLFRQTRSSTFLTLHLKDRALPVRLAVDRQDADRVVSILQGLRDKDLL
jgi:hypothetical protein